MTSPIPNLFKVPELKEKLLFTLLCLVIYRIGAHIATPGVNVDALADFMSTRGTGTLFGLYDLFSGGGLTRATVFALGIMPYISASIVFQLAGPVFPIIEKMQRDEEGKKTLTQWTRYVTVVLCLFQAYGFAIFTEQLTGAVAHPGWGFRMTTVLTLTTGGIFVMWLGEQITERGIGNGMSLLIFFSIVERILPETVNTFEALKSGTLSFPVLLVVLVMMILVVAGTVAITVAARRIPVQIPRKVMGRGRIREGQKTFIPLRINSAGVMPIIFAQSLIIVPGTIATFSGVPWLKTFAEYFNTTSVWYIASSAVLIVFFAYFYTSIIFNPVDLAENLKKQGGFIPGVKPGAPTADYIDEVLTRITLPGALFLTFVALIPIVISNTLNMPFGFGGTALLIVVGVALDTVQQVQQHLLLRQYDGFMKGGGPGSGGGHLAGSFPPLVFILILGAPGSGKGTQGKILAERLGLPKITTGDLIRKAMKDGTPLGLEAKKYYDEGKLVPDSIVLNMIKEELARPEAKNGAILDGFPRTAAQAELVDRTLAERGQRLNHILLLDVTEDELVRRMRARAQVEGRADDSPEAIATRLQVYQRDTAPLIAHYAQRGIVHRVPGTGTVDEIAGEIKRIIGR